ncbi:uncharacterized protein RAG0_00379 [Rhynchosporium agropyri]|uniref:DUF2510 domain-containing protein n=1 Tax=Rhynchosporium agropyri TaxID=914238 RepID=A0A1E1JSC9_9HELO|nr:uncharacterized protein RAG0_00379 [Rhynchosporium agropyri]
MTSRGFSTSVRAAKALKWKFNGTTVQVDDYVTAVETAVDALPSKLAAKAKVGIIQGNPHATPENNDPMHASDGRVVFSDPALKPFNKGPDGATDSPSQAAGSLSASQQPTSSDWVWDETSRKYKYWDGEQWVFQK